MGNLSLDGIIIIVVLTVIFGPIILFLTFVTYTDWYESKTKHRDGQGYDLKLEMKTHFAALITVVYALFCVLHLPPAGWMPGENNLIVLALLAVATFRFYRESRADQKKNIWYNQPLKPKQKLKTPEEASDELSKEERDANVVAVLKKLKTQDNLYMYLALAVNKYPPSLVGPSADAINTLATTLPPFGLIENSENGIPWGHYIRTEFYRIDSEGGDGSYLVRALSQLGTRLSDEIKSIPIKVGFPEHLRTQHQHIVAGTGRGKTQCIQNMVMDDVAAGNSVVLIDSQGDMINKLATRIPKDRLVLIDPQTCPPALNIFDNKGDVNTAIELYEYIFSALDASMTSKQTTAYRFVSRLLLTIPGANIHTMRRILEPNGTTPYLDNIKSLGETAHSFFEFEYDSRQFRETRQQVLRRLYTVLENTTFEQMLGANENRLDIAGAIDSGKVVLVSTAKSYLKQTGSSLFGRIFIAQVMQAVMSRQSHRHRTYLYIDEFQDYAEDSHVLFNLFEQERKYELGIIAAHQYIGQLTPQLQQSIAANTAIKLAGGVSAQDSRIMAAQMHTTSDEINNVPKGSFAAYYRDIGTVPYYVDFGRLEKTPEITSLVDIQKDMRVLYGVQEKPPKTVTVRKADASRLRIRPRKEDGPAPEKGEW